MSRDVTSDGRIFTNALRQIVMAEPDEVDDGTVYWPSFAGKLQNIAAEALEQPGVPRTESVLSEAARLVDGDRQTAYGHPRDNHACTAALWTAYFKRCGLLRDDAELTPRQVCIANVLQKCSRDANTPGRDNLVDLAGFAANADMVDER